MTTFLKEFGMLQYSVNRKMTHRGPAASLCWLSCQVHILFQSVSLACCTVSGTSTKSHKYEFLTRCHWDTTDMLTRGSLEVVAYQLNSPEVDLKTLQTGQLPFQGGLRHADKSVERDIKPESLCVHICSLNESCVNKSNHKGPFFLDVIIQAQVTSRATTNLCRVREHAGK